jgi:hypothetical protein
MDDCCPAFVVSKCHAIFCNHFITIDNKAIMQTLRVISGLVAGCSRESL